MQSVTISEGARSVVDGFYSAFEPPRRVTAVEWVEENRVLSSKGSSRPGKWRHSNAPYGIGILKELNNPTTRKIVLEMAAQTIKTEIIQNALMYFTDVDPADCLIVYPNNEILKRVIKTRLKPTVTINPSVSRHLIETKTSMGYDGFEFQTCNWMFGSANSPADLSSNPIRILIIDEADKGPAANRKSAEGYWVDLAEERTNTFYNSITIIACTPTTEDGVIHQEYMDSDQREWFVPCLECGETAPYAWEKVRWEPKPEGVSDREYAKLFDVGKVPIWYECDKCGHRHTEKDKWAMNARGEWIAKRPGGTVAGFHLSAIANQIIRWSSLAAKFFRSKGSPKKMRNFKNSVLAQVWTESKKSFDTNIVTERRGTLPRGIVPAWTRVITAGVDVQGDGLWWSVWAWAKKRRAALVAYGKCASPEEFMLLVMGVHWEREGGGSLVIGQACIDANYDPYKVIGEFLIQHQDHGVVGIIGKDELANTANRMKVSKIVRPSGEAPLLILDTKEYKDTLEESISRPPHSELSMSFPSDVESWYALQFTAEEKLEELDKYNNKKFVWVPKRADNHMWDTAVYALAAADLLGFFEWDEQERVETARREAHVVGLEERNDQQSQGFRMPDGRPYLVTERG